MEDAPQRRAIDPVIARMQGQQALMQEQLDHLHECIEAVKSIGAENKAALSENTAITKDVRDILATFRILGQVAKWATAMGAFGVMLYHGWQKITGR